ncbi:hypothetical protein Csa_020262 [Cucumis sativus]|nr:hypothetical protein Csa_020262 [Cucumis sativus]
MTPWFFVLLFLVAKAQATMTNQTDLQAAMDEMRLKSYHGFVILLKILNNSNKTLQNSDITFFMPTDQELSQADISLDQLEEFVLRHSIPTTLLLNNLSHFPNGSLVPSSIPNRMIKITKSRMMDTLPAKQSLAEPIVQRNEKKGAKSLPSTTMKKNRSLH